MKRDEGWICISDGQSSPRTDVSGRDEQPGRANLPTHRNALVDGHSKEKGCTLLVWYAQFDDLQDARACELRMKKWKRNWKLRLIEEQNLDWRDLYDDILA